MQQLDKRAIWLFFIGSILGWVVGGFFFLLWVTIGVESLISATQGEQNWVFDWWVVKLVTLILLLLAYFWAKLTYHYYRYELTELGFCKESGVIYKRYVTIPYDRIQNVDIYRGILARILGLSDLQI